LRPLNHISGLAEATVVIFCTQVDYIVSQPKVDKSSLNGLGQCHARDPFFNFDARNHICGTAEATVAKFCMQVESSAWLSMTDYSLMGVMSHVIHFLNFAPNISLELVKICTANFIC